MILCDLRRVLLRANKGYRLSMNESSAAAEKCEIARGSFLSASFRMIIPCFCIKLCRVLVTIGTPSTLEDSSRRRYTTNWCCTSLVTIDAAVLPYISGITNHEWRFVFPHKRQLVVGRFPG